MSFEPGFFICDRQSYAEFSIAHNSGVVGDCRKRISAGDPFPAQSHEITWRVGADAEASPASIIRYSTVPAFSSIPQPIPAWGWWRYGFDTSRVFIGMPKLKLSVNWTLRSIVLRLPLEYYLLYYSYYPTPRGTRMMDISRLTRRSRIQPRFVDHRPSIPQA